MFLPCQDFFSGVSCLSPGCVLFQSTVHIVPKKCHSTTTNLMTPKPEIIKEKPYRFGGPVVEIPCSHYRGCSFDPCLGTKIPHAAWLKKQTKDSLDCKPSILKIYLCQSKFLWGQVLNIKKKTLKILKESKCKTFLKC